jgi:glycerol-3-phosphate acyltransferase PlsY
MLPLVIAGFASYLIGSIPAGYIAGRIVGIDIRTVGSGNIGATNVTRVLGKRYGYPVFIVDFLKGFAGVVGAVACVLGHSFPVWLGFKGGKGVAASAGALFGLTPFVALIAVAVWLVIFYLTRYVSVASMTAALAVPIAILSMTFLGQTGGTALLYFSICLAAVVIVRHRSNLSRLVRGTEPRFKRK